VKALSAAVTLCLLAAGPALAQSKPAAKPAAAPAKAAGLSCAKPEKVAIPDPKKAKTAEMEAAQKALTDYTTKLNAYLKCLDKAEADAQAEYKTLSDQWNKAVDIYSKRPG